MSTHAETLLNKYIFIAHDLGTVSDTYFLLGLIDTSKSYCYIQFISLFIITVNLSWKTSCREAGSSRAKTMITASAAAMDTSNIGPNSYGNRPLVS